MQSWRKRLPHPALVFVVLAWGLNFTVIKIAFLEVSAPALGLLRYLTMLPLLCLWCMLVGQSLKYPKGTFWRLNLAGFAGSGAYMVLFLEGMKTAPPALASVALGTSPIMTTILSVLVKQDKFTWRLLAGSLIGFAGVAVCAYSPDPSTGSVSGALLIVCSAAFWATSIILYRPLLTDMSAVRVLTLSFPGAMVAIVPYGWTALVTSDWGAVTWLGWASIVYLVLIAGVAAFAAYYKGLSDVGPARTSMIQYFVPPVAAIFSALILRTPITWNEVVGLGVVIAGVATATAKTPAPAIESP